jgi:hypothetical protein
MTDIDETLTDLIGRYQASFTQKVYDGENDDGDPLMDVFAITPDLKRENRQYWGRELGMCWQLMVTEVFRQFCDEFGPALRYGSDEPCDLTVSNIAIDTKYRIGSGDSGTLKKFRQYGELLLEQGYEPVFLIVREDNLPAAIRACTRGGWSVHTGDSTFDYIKSQSGFDLKEFLVRIAGGFGVHR